LVTAFSRNPAALDVDSGERPEADLRRLLEETLEMLRHGAPADEIDDETREMLEALGYL
jgi:hypothetical protein